MKNLVFRTLMADEIEVRVQSVTEKGVVLLLYKDARCDMALLDETVGPMNWKKFYSRDNRNCIVYIYDDDKNDWVGKEDTGTESNTEAEKGLASDSFKRACFNWGIGRELYTAPFIFIPAEKVNITKGKNGNLTCYDRFEVSDISYNEKRRINYLLIKNSKTHKEVFSFCKPTNFGIAPPKPRISSKAYAEEPRKEEPKKEETATPEISSSDLLVKLCAELDVKRIPYSFVSDAFGVKAIGYIPDDKIKLMLTEKGMRKLENSYMKSMVQIAEDAELPYV